MAKYIIDIPSPNIHNEYIVYWTYDGLEAKRVSDLTPYIEPDIEQVRKETWETVRKIIRMPEGDLLNLFTECYSAVCTSVQVFLKYDASECIEKIRQYEDGKHNFEVGDEIAFHHVDGRPDTVVVVTYIGDDGYVDGIDGKGTLYAHKNPKRWTKTGRHFPEIATVFKKIRGEQDGKRREE